MLVWIMDHLTSRDGLKLKHHIFKQLFIFGWTTPWERTAKTLVFCQAYQSLPVMPKNKCLNKWLSSDKSFELR